MIIGLPPYQPLACEPVRCPCRRAYLVHVGLFDFEAGVAERTAHDLGVRFVDARREPFVTCECGRTLNFSPAAVTG